MIPLRSYVIMVQTLTYRMLLLWQPSTYKANIHISKFLPKSSSADLLISVTNLDEFESLTIPSESCEESEPFAWDFAINPDGFLNAARNSSSHHNTNLTEANEADLGKSNLPPIMPLQIVF